MKLPEFDHKSQKWDQYGEFYVNHGRDWNGLFVQFATGELICTDHFRTSSGWGHSSHRRGYFESLGLTVFQMNDNPSFLYGKKLWDPRHQCDVKRTWMLQAVPMIYDHGHNRIVVIRWHNEREEASQQIPERLVGRCGVYWAGEKRPPVGGGPIYYRKLKKHSIEVWREAKAKRGVIMAQFRVLGEDPRGGRWRNFEFMPVDKLARTELTDLSKEQRRDVAVKGLTAGYDLVQTEYLEVRNV